MRTSVENRRALPQPASMKTKAAATKGKASVIPSGFLAPLPAVGPITATKVDSFTDSDSDGKAELGQQIDYTVTITNTGTNDATGMIFNDTIDLQTTLIGNSLNVSPLAVDDPYTTVGNTLLEVGVTPSGYPSVVVNNPANDSVLDNDKDFAGDSAPTLKTPLPTSSANGGTVTMNSNGTFSYLPPVGFTGTDTFTYTITDDGADNIANNADDLTGTGTVTITVGSPKVWYVDNSYAGANGVSDGRSTRPYTTLAPLNVSATDPDVAGDIIYVHTGSGNYLTGIAMESNQQLIGNGVALIVNSFTLRAAGTRPTIAAAAGDAVSVPEVSGVVIRGLNLGSATNNAIDVTATGANNGGVEIADNVITGSGPAQEGIDVNGGGSTMTVSIHDNTVTASGNGIDIARTAGTVTVTAFDDNLVTGNTGFIGINVTGGAGSVVFDAVVGGNFDTVSGGATAVGQAGNGVGTSGMVLSNIRGDLNFTDLDIVADNGNALLISGSGGTPNFTASSGTRVTANTNTPTVSATNGAAVSAADANINLAFTSLTSTNSAGSGVSLSRLSGSFSAPSGSAINNASGADFFIDGLSHANANISVTYGGTITDDQGMLVQIQNATSAGGTHTFSGAITDGNDGDGNGISLTNNGGATMNFTGGLTLSTGGNTAFNATGGGTLNITNTNVVTTTTGAALNITDTTIGVSGVTFQSVNSATASSNVTVNLSNTGSGTFTISGTGTTGGSGGTIDNKTTDAMRFNNTDGLVTLKNMIIEDIGSTAGGIDTISGHDAIHAEQIDGGMTLDNMTIRRISDNAINGTTIASGAATVFNGLTINNSTFQFTNRFHVANVGDANNEGMIRILGIRGTVNITNNTLEDGGEHLDFFVTGGTLTMTATNNNFNRAYKEFTSGGTASVGGHCIDVTVQSSGSANVTVGDLANAALGNDFLNCRIGSVRMVNDTGSTGSLTGTVARNNFVVNDHSSGIGGDFDFPMGGVLFWSLASGNTTARISTNYFDETTRASGNLGSVGVLADLGTVNARIDGNTFDTLGDGTWTVRARNNATQRLKVDNNTYIRGFFTCPDTACGGGYFGPALYQLAEAQSGGNMQITVDNETFNLHDTSFYPGNSLELRTTNVGAAPTVCAQLSNLRAPQGYALENNAGTFNLYRGASAFTGVCTTAQCQAVLAANNVLGGGGVNTTNPPTINHVGTVNVTSTQCQQSSLAMLEGDTNQRDYLAKTDNNKPQQVEQTRGASAKRSAPSAEDVITHHSSNKPVSKPVAKKAAASSALNIPYSQLLKATTKQFASKASVKPQASRATESKPQSKNTAHAATLAPPAGENININIGTLPGGSPSGKSITIKFSVTVNDPFTGLNQYVSNQGHITGGNFSQVDTDDPAPPAGFPNTAGADPTITPVDAIQITIGDVSIAEGAVGDRSMVFTITLSNPAPLAGVSVNYQTANNTAIAGATPTGDYQTSSGTATVTSGNLTGTFSVPVHGDTVFEGNETFFVNLSTPVNASLLDTQAIGTIADDEPQGTDFDGDGLADPSVWADDSQWKAVLSSTNTAMTPYTWGSAAAPYNDIAVPGDYDGDNKTDFAVWRPSEGNWYIVRSSDSVQVTKGWGAGSLGDVPVPGDYDGDGKTDIAVWRAPEGNWYVLRSSTDTVQLTNWGGFAGDVPVPADYDGDGKTDAAVFRPSEGNWYILYSSNGALITKPWGISTDTLVPGDYDGDGKADLAIWRGSEGNWYIVSSRDGSTSVKGWGGDVFSDIPVPADYDGDGRTDIAVWRPSEGNWYILKSSTNTDTLVTFGVTPDKPVPSLYPPQ